MKFTLQILFCIFSFSLTVAQSKEVSVLDAREFKTMEDFYRASNDKPVIVKNAYIDDEYLKTLTPAVIESLFRPHPIWGYAREDDATGRIRRKLDGNEFFDDLNNGAKKYYVFDYSVTASPLKGKVEVPHFLNDNWLDQLDPSNCLNITLSGVGSFTPFHEDGSGTQAWMYLVYGKKEWKIYPPALRPLIYDVLYQSFYNPRKEEDYPGQFRFVQLAEDESYDVVAQGGDLIFIPPGWSHQVLTTEISFGLGGNIVNEYQAYESRKTSLVEHSSGLQTSFSLKDLLQNNESRINTEYGLDQVKRAKELENKWVEATKNKVNTKPVIQLSWPYEDYEEPQEDASQGS